MMKQLFNFRIFVITSALLVMLFAPSRAQNCPSGIMLTHDLNATIQTSLGYNVQGAEVRYYKNYDSFNADIIIDSVTIGIYNIGDVQLRIYAYSGIINASTLDTSLLVLLDTSAILTPPAAGAFFNIPLEVNIPAGTKIVVEQRLVGGGTEMYVMGMHQFGSITDDRTYIAVPSDPALVTPSSINELGLPDFFFMGQGIYYHTVKYQGDSMSMCSSQLPIILNGTLMDTAGIYDIIYSNAAGCDSIVTIPLTVAESSIHAGDSLTACDSELPLIIHGVIMDTTGFYHIQYTNAAGCDSIMAIYLTAHPAINMSFAITENTMTLSQNGATYKWINCTDNSIIAGENGQSFTATSNGSYAAIITIDGCSDTTVCAELSTVGVGNHALNTTFDIYPNPVAGQLDLKFKDIATGNLKVTISDLNGRVLIQSEHNVNARNAQLSQDVSQLNAGIYFINVNGVNKKFVKK